MHRLRESPCECTVYSPRDVSPSEHISDRYTVFDRFYRFSCSTMFVSTPDLVQEHRFFPYAYAREYPQLLT
jgi:hypothetical protein